MLPTSTCPARQVVPFPHFDVQARFAHAVWSGSLTLPSKADMLQHMRADRERRREMGFPVHYAHRMGVLQWEYHDELCDMAGVPRLEPWRREVGRHVARGAGHPGAERSALIAVRRKLFVLFF